MAELTTTETKLEAVPPENHLRRFLHGSGFAAGSLVINGGLTLLTAIVLARWLKPEAFGTYSIAVVVIALLGGLGAAGMDTAVARFVAFYSGSGQTELIRPVLRFGVRWATIVSVTLAVASFLLLAFSEALPAKVKPLRPLAVYVSLAVPLWALSLVLLQAVLHLGAMKARMVIEKMIQPLLRLALPFGAVLVLRDRLAASVAAVLLATVVCTLAAGFVLRGMTASIPRGSKPAREEIRRWSGYAAPFALQSLQNFASSGLGVDLLMVGLLASLSASGVYAAAFRFTPLLTLVRAAMDYAFGPRVSVLFGRADFASIDVLYKASSAVGLAVTVPLGIIMALFSHAWMTTFFGEMYSGGAVALAWLVIGCVADSATGCNTTLLTVVGKPWLVLTNGLVGGIFTVVLCFLLIPQFGIAGAAFSVTVARVCVNCLATAELWRLQHVQPFSKDIIKLALPAAGTALAGYLLKTQFPAVSHGGVFPLVVVAAALLGVYAVGLRLAGLHWPQPL